MLKENKMFSIQPCGINGINVKLTAVNIDDQSKKGLNLPFFEFELSIIIERIGARTRPNIDATIPETKIKPVETLK